MAFLCFTVTSFERSQGEKQVAHFLAECHFIENVRGKWVEGKIEKEIGVVEKKKVQESIFRIFSNFNFNN